MAARYYCDGCGEEMKETDHGRLRLRLGSITIEVIHAFQNTWNGNNICHACIRNVINKGEPASEACGYLSSRSLR